MEFEGLLRSGVTVADLQRSAFGRLADTIALSSERGALTYGELDHAIGRTAQLFHSVGLRKGDGFAVLSSNRLEVVMANWAAQRLGLRYTPLHPRGSLQDHLYILGHAEISALFVDDDVFEERGRELADSVSLKAIFSAHGRIGVALAAAAAVFPPDPIPVDSKPDDICNIFFTGGTTGRPKGAVHRSTSIVTANLLSLATWEWPRDIRFLLAAPVSHAGGAMLLPTLMRGGSFHMLERFRPEEFLAEVEKRRITASFLVPTMIYDLLDCPRLGEFDMSSLEMIIYGAAPMAPARMVEALEKIGPVFCQLYGQTEAPNLISYLARGDHDPSRPERLYSCGRPVAGNHVQLLGADDRPCGPGEVGEICVRGPLVMQEYWKDPVQTEEVFRDGWLRTGDLAHADADGYLYIVDRAKDLIISGGFNVYSREVEDCLVAHPAVSAAAVIGVPHARWGEAVAAFVVPKSGQAPVVEDLVAFVKERKGDVYAPKQIQFVDALPVTAVGKIDKKAMRQVFWTDADRLVG